MFDSLKNMVGQVTGGNLDPTAVGQAATQHLGSMNAGDVSDQVQNAAQTAQQNGQGDVASQLMGLVQQAQSNPEGIKGAAISFIQQNPQVLAHFAPEFAQGILSKVGF